MDKRKTIWLVTILLLSIIGYVWIGYGTVRTNFAHLVALYAFLFGLYLVALFRRVFDVNLSIFLGAVLALRVSLVFMTPNLTDDYFRYVWDGLLFSHGYNPYLVLPSEFIHSPQTVPGITPALYESLNSTNYYTVYPPLCQFLFGLSAKLMGGNILGNVIVIRLVILLAELGIIVVLYKLATRLAISRNVIAIYAFNPLVIIELTGNIHLEAVMLFFLILAVYLLVQGRQVYAAVSLGLAVGVKLLPLIFLPLLIKRLGLIRSMILYAIVAGTFIFLFGPFFNADLIANFFSTLGLYFQKFEFNASIYYLLRWLGYQVTGYNMIAALGIVLAIASFATIIAISVREKIITWQSLFESMLICGTAYFLLATTVHPWYITSLILVSVFTRYRYPIVWTIFISLSYAAYRTLPYSENLWLVTLEYIGVFGWMSYELVKKHDLKLTCN